MADFLQLLETPSVAKALRTLQSLTDRPVQFKDLASLAKDHPDQPIPGHLETGATIPTDEGICVYIGSRRPEQTAVHELLHQVLTCEGYPEVLFCEGAECSEGLAEAAHRLRCSFQNAIEHPEIYRRMEIEYGIAMAEYFQQKALEHVERIERLNRQVRGYAYLGQRQYDILQCLECFFFGIHGRTALDSFKRYCREAHSSCFRLYEEIRPVGFSTPGAALECAKCIRNHIVLYGKERSVVEETSQLWPLLEFRLRDA